MIEVSIIVNVDGISYGANKTESSVLGYNNTSEALALLEKQIAVLRRAMLANANPTVEYRTGGPVNANRGSDS